MHDVWRRMQQLSQKPEELILTAGRTCAGCFSMQAKSPRKGGSNHFWLDRLRPNCFEVQQPVMDGSLVLSDKRLSCLFVFKRDGDRTLA